MFMERDGVGDGRPATRSLGGCLRAVCRVLMLGITHQMGRRGRSSNHGWVPRTRHHARWPCSIGWALVSEPVRDTKRTRRCGGSRRTVAMPHCNKRSGHVSKPSRVGFNRTRASSLHNNVDEHLEVQVPSQR